MDRLESNDEYLMQLVKKDQLEAAQQLFLRYRSRIFGFFRHLTADAALSEDLTQDVFERMIRYRASYKDGHRFQTWIFQIARNVRLDHLQTHHRTTLLAEQAAKQKLPQTDDPYDPIFLRERQHQLQQALQQLKVSDRELIYLSKFEHLKYQEISRLTGKPENAVKVAVHRALKQLKVHFFSSEND